ncbi:MAG TPA: hypothetical protein VKG38_04025 [Solirubrobacteraceae bacterium]|nr:hypothetical protein [Solirubrobacteraceae bacterium]
MCEKQESGSGAAASGVEEIRNDNSGFAQGTLPTEVAASTSGSGGFQWGDAGIGAAGMLVVLGVGGALVVNARRRSHRRGLAAR